MHDNGPWLGNFIRELIKHGNDTLIRSTCGDCGKWATANMIDGKILLWEQSHVCESVKRRPSRFSATQDAAPQDH